MPINPPATTKPWYTSNGVWGALTTVGAGIAGIWGYVVSAPDQAELAQAGADLATKVAAHDWQGLIVSGIATVGGLYALWGRLRATKTIGSK